jgi:hypothetical protein
MRNSRFVVGSRAVLVTVLVMVGLVGAPTSAVAAVSVTRASLGTSGALTVEGRGAIARSAVTVTSLQSTARGTADRDGRFRVTASGFAASDCRATIADPSTSVTVTLSGCTPSTPPPPAAPLITPDVAEIGPGFVGSDFTTFSATTSTMTFGPNTLGPVRFDIVDGALPAGLTLVDPNAGSTPAKSVHASVSGTPTTVQVSTFTVRATDANGLTATRAYTIRVNAARTLDLAPQGPAPTLTIGTSTNWWFDGLGGVRPYRWAVSNGQLPPGMTLVQDNPSGPLVRIAGAPTTAGSSTFTLRLTDAQAATVSRTFTLTVPPASTSTAPAAPTLLAPAAGASVTTPFTIDWTQEFDPSLSANGGYNWQVSTTSSFSTFALRDSTLPTVTEATISGLAPGTYFWRVQAVDGQLRSSPFSAPRTVTVTGATAGQPGTPVLRLPSYGSSFHPFETFELFWTAADRAATYELLASKDPTFQTNPIKIDNIAGTSTGLTIGDFCGGCEQGTYSARVVAIDANGNRGVPSNTVTFTISFTAPLPPPPTALSPAAGASVTLPVTLDWSDVPNPQSSGYEIFVAKDAGFTDVELQGRTTASQLQVLSLTPGTKFWRVYSVQGNDAPDSPAVTAPSATRSFTVASAGAAVQSVWLGAPPCTDPCPGADTLFSGQEITGSIQLASAAPAGGAVVTLASNPAAGASHPPTVTVPAGTAFTTFRLFAGQVAQDTPVTLTATLGSSSDTFVFTVKPTTVKLLSFCCDSTGGLPAAAHLSLTGQVPSGGVVVSLSSDSPLAQPPATVSVPAGSFSIPVSIPTSQVTTTTTVTISATHAGTTVSTPLRLYPQQPPSAVTLDRTATTGTQGASGTVRIAEGQAHEVLVRLTSSHPQIAAVPAYAQIGSFGVAGAFTVTTQAPAVSTDVTISAVGAGVTRTTVLTVHPAAGPGPAPAPAVSALSLSPTTVTGGSQSSTGTVTLSAPAPTGGVSVALTSSQTGAATVPTAVTVPAGASSATFAVTSKSVTAPTSATITAAADGVSRTAVLTVNPAAQGATVGVALTATGRSGERVTSSPAGLSVAVGSTGSATFPSGTRITLTVSNGRDAVWSGACSSGGARARTCAFTPTGPASVTANVQ